MKNGIIKDKKYVVVIDSYTRSFSISTGFLQTGPNYILINPTRKSA